MASGKEMLDGDMEYRYGLMGRGMKVTGLTEKQMDKVYFILLRKIHSCGWGYLLGRMGRR